MNGQHLLLAKSQRRMENGRWTHPVSVLGHSKSVLEAARAILVEIEDFLPPEVDRSKLRTLATVGGLLHDIGKANDLFQGILSRESSAFPRLGRDQRQPIRHEGLSALIVVGYVDEAREFSDHLASADGPFREWGEADEREKALWMLAWVVGGHHLRMHWSENGLVETVRDAGIPPGPIHFHGNYLGEVWQREFADDLCDAPYVPDFSIPTDPRDSDKHHVALMEDFGWESKDRSESLSPEEERLLAFAKAIVIAADAAGSALWKRGTGDEEVRLENGIRTSLRNHCRRENLMGVVRDRLDRPENADYEATLHPFQRRVRDSRESRVVLEAACGSGKTVAAYEWAQRHVETGRKLFVCYPTTGTAAAGFEDYLLVQGKLERTLVTSRADVDVRRMLANRDDPGHPDRNEDQELLMKQESLQAWGQQVIAATADTVLGLMQNHRRSLFSFPAIVKSAIVFDEIHSYDSKMFGSLVRFLKAFSNIPVLLMTASLQRSRREALEKLDVGYELIPGDDEEERKGRYRLEWCEGQASAPDEWWDDVQDTLDKGEKVLWVCNTVGNAVRIYEKAEEKLRGDAKRILFHSRFCYRHRVKRQDEVLAAFAEDGPCLAVTTQVCEMSLDISANLLVTALPPFPALVQRMGRLNRRRENPDGARCLVHDYGGMGGRSPYADLPYNRADLEASRGAIRSLVDGDKVLSQRDLKNALEGMPETSDNIKFGSVWLDGGWESKQSNLREGEPTRQVLLAEHEDRIRESIKEVGERAAVREWLVPILTSAKGVRTEGQIRKYPLVSGVKYDRETGAR